MADQPAPPDTSTRRRLQDDLHSTQRISTDLLRRLEAAPTPAT